MLHCSLMGGWMLQIIFDVCAGPKPFVHDISYSPPDPDTMYKVSEAAPYTTSPVVEVFEHNTNVIHRQIARREEIALSRLTASQKARQEVSGTPQTPTDCYSTPITTATTVTSTPPTTTATPIPPRPPFEMRTCSQLNAVLHRRDFRKRVNNQPDSANLDPPPCIQRRCPFCRGPLLLQRFSLLQRLYQLNTLLYGNIKACDDLQQY